MVASAQALVAKRSGFKFYLCRLSTGWTWTRFLAFLCLGQIEIIRPNCGAPGRLIRHSKHLAHNRYCRAAGVITKIGHLAAVPDAAPASAPVVWRGTPCSGDGRERKGGATRWVVQQAETLSQEWLSGTSKSQVSQEQQELHSDTKEQTRSTRHFAKAKLF